MKRQKRQGPSARRAQTKWVSGRTGTKLSSQSTRRKTFRTKKSRNSKKMNFSLAKFLQNRFLVGLSSILIVAVINFVPTVKVKCQTIDQEACKSTNYQQTVDKELGLWQKFKPFLDKKDLTAEIASLPVVASAEMDYGWFNIATINVLESKGAILWSSLSSDQQNFLIDSRGVAIEAISKQENKNVQLSILDSSPIAPVVGDLVVDPSIITAITEFEASKVAVGFTVVTAEIDDTPREFTINLARNDTKKVVFKIAMTTARPLEEQLIDVSLSLDYFEEKGRKYSYLDVRLASATVYR